MKPAPPVTSIFFSNPFETGFIRTPAPLSGHPCLKETSPTKTAIHYYIPGSFREK
jgi:hypothetical protein